MKSLLRAAFLSMLTLLLIIDFSFAGKPDGHAPIGVMRDHVHKKNQLMLSYRYAFMKMRGLINNQNEVSTSENLNNYMSAPTSMDMQKHMIGAMYGLTDNLTLSAMGSFIEKKMNHINSNTGKFARKSGGIGDTVINGSYQFFNKNNNKLQFNLAVSLPTGSIDEDHNNARLPYGMQVGSGSYDLLPGISYSGRHKSSYSYGGQINGTFRLEDNKHDYRFGNKYNFTVWIAKNLNNAFSLSSRIDYTITEAIEGVDPTLNSAMIVTADGSLYDGKRLDLFLGTNFIVPNGYLKGNRFAIEFGAPIYQKLDGPQLRVDYKLIIGWQKMF